MGPYTRQAVAEQRAAAATRPDPDAGRRLYEQIGALYQAATEAGTVLTGDGCAHDDRYEQELADFLATVREVARTARTPAGEALATAIRRYERDRTGA